MSQLSYDEICRRVLAKPDDQKWSEYRLCIKGDLYDFWLRFGNHTRYKNFAEFKKGKGTKYA